MTAMMLSACSATSVSDEAEDVADATAREVAKSVASQAVEERLATVEARLDALEQADRANLESHLSILNASVESTKQDREQVEKIRQGYNDHLKFYHGVRD